MAPFVPDLARWEAWRPEEVRRLLATVGAPWCVVAGWALDLFAGEQLREHGDLEIAVPRDRFGEIAAALRGFELFAVGDGLAWPLAEAPAALHQTWVRDPGTGLWRVDVFREPAEGDMWICRRDPRIRLPYARLVERTPDGIPYARPEVVLLFKAKRVRPKDEADLAAVLPRLDPARRTWLREALTLAHPGHPWLAQLL